MLIEVTGAGEGGPGARKPELEPHCKNRFVWGVQSTNGAWPLERRIRLKVRRIDRIV